MDSVFTFVQQFCYIEAERQISSLMGARKFAVNIYLCCLIDCTNVKDQPHAVPLFRDPESASIQHEFVLTGQPVEP